MRRIVFLLIFLIKITFCQAQYSKEKLSDILTGGSTKAWSVKESTSPSLEKLYAFNKNLTVEIGKGTVKPHTEKWALATADNIRWFITIGNQKYELIVSYDKSGKQYIKLNNQSGDSKAPVYSETILYPAK